MVPKRLTGTRRFSTMNRISAPTRWYQRLVDLAELHGDHDQQQIAHAIGVTKGTVTGWKQGTPPKPDSVLAAAKHYGVDPLELLRIAYLDGDEPAEEPKPKNRKRSRQPPRQGSNVPPL
jgi:transcriptional regulator with XRE-family HTH domain